MALINCTIDTQSLTKIGGQAIGSQNVNLTITPDQFHSVRGKSCKGFRQTGGLSFPY